MNSLLGSCFFWALSMAWHLWRVASFRPAFKGIGDTGFAFASFLVVYFAASLFRWYGIYEMPLPDALFGACIHLVILVFLFERNRRSSSLVYIALASSAVVDLVAIAAAFLGLTAVNSKGFLGIEVLLYAWAYLCFKREPIEVQAKGYKRKSPAQPARSGK